MTRINTNISSLQAQVQLQNSNNQLQTSLTRLSTGLRINSGADDPAGLIASTDLGNSIASTQSAIGNSQTANQVISTADSALSQVSALLTSIRGLVTQAANTGAESSDQIAANQLQVDSSLSAIDKIAQTTSFQGKNLLDGSLDFTTVGTSNFNQISNLQISQANLGTNNLQAVSVNVTAAATQANVNITNVPAATAAVNATQTLALSHLATQASGSVSLATTSGISLNITAKAGGAAAGAAGNNVNLVIVNGSAVADTYDAGTNTITVNDADVTTLTGNTLAAQIAAVDGGNDFTVTAATGGATSLVAGDASTYSNITTGGRSAGSSTIKVISSSAGSAANGKTITLTNAGGNANTATATVDATTGNLSVALSGNVTAAQIASAIGGATGFSAQITASTGDQNTISGTDTLPAAATLAGGVDAGGGITQDVTFSLSGSQGTQVFNFGAGTSATQIQTAIHALASSTGVDASIIGTTLALTSTDYGSASTVGIKVISEGAGGTITAAVGEGANATGTDVAGTINGIAGTGSGNTLSTNTAALSASLNVATGYTGAVDFNITGGGATFQLGANVTANNQSRIGIQSVASDSLGGVDGLLYELASGGAAALATDPGSAANIVDEASSQVTSLRGRLGAFESATVNSNISSLTNAVTNLTSAQSTIQDADFAAETANLSRAQVLVQSGTAVLGIANKNPQQVLSLIQNA